MEGRDRRCNFLLTAAVFIDPRGDSEEVGAAHGRDEKAPQALKRKGRDSVAAFFFGGPETIFA
ncbi:MAG TPA: hypothetical protein VFL14_10640, partial [Xanthomonadales bacterium]|nr:hypothetical protein [Xanthomonadales bacterium]